MIELYVCKSKGQTRIDEDNNVLHNAVIWGGILNLLEVVDFVDTKFEKYEIIGANTDAVYFGCNKLVEQKNSGYFYDKTFKVGVDEFRKHDYVIFEDRELPRFNKKWRLNKDGSYFNNGMGGGGKSEMAIRENVDKKILGLSFENSAVDNLNSICEKNGVVDYLNKTIHVALGLRLDGDDNVEGIDFDKFDVVIIDEFFRIVPGLVGKLFGKLKEFKGKIIVIGDGNQNKYICGNGEEFNYDYAKCDFVGELVGFNYYRFSDEEMNAKIEKGECRYNREMYDVIKHFEKYGNVDGFNFKPIDLSLKVNIVRSNKMKNKINSRFSDKIKIGDRCILLVNTSEYNKLGFFNGYMFEVESIGELVNGVFKICDIELNYGTTCHKYQGRTIREPFNIFEVEKMSKEVFYTALTRATKIEDIHLDTSKLKRKFRTEFGKNIFREVNRKLESGNVYKVEDGKFSVYWNDLWMY